MADLFTVPSLPQTYSVDLYNADTFVLWTVVSLVCPFDSGKTSPCEKLYSTGTSVYQGEFYWFERISTSTIRTSLYQLVPEMPIYTIPTFKQGQCSNADTCLRPCGILSDKLRPHCFPPKQDLTNAARLFGLRVVAWTGSLFFFLFPIVNLGF